MNGKRNYDCDLVKRNKIPQCWTCECGKHHEVKSGADYCCTDNISSICDCRHCNTRRREAPSAVTSGEEI